MLKLHFESVPFKYPFALLNIIPMTFRSLLIMGYDPSRQNQEGVLQGASLMECLLNFSV